MILAAVRVEHLAKNDNAIAPAGQDFLPLPGSTKQGLVNPDQGFMFSGHEHHALTHYSDIDDFTPSEP